MGEGGAFFREGKGPQMPQQVPAYVSFARSVLRPPHASREPEELNTLPWAPSLPCSLAHGGVDVRGRTWGDGRGAGRQGVRPGGGG